MKYVILKLILLYQTTLSLDHGFLKFLKPYGFCKFRPTCSEYMYLAIDKYGVILGGIKGIKRILRCHPFSKGGYEPIK